MEKIENRNNEKGFFYTFSYYVYLVFSVLTLYISGTLFITIALADILYQLLGVLSSFLAFWYSEYHYFFDFISKLTWMIYSFGTNVLTFHLMIFFFLKFFQTLKGIVTITNDESKKLFWKDFNLNSKSKLFFYITTFLIVGSVFLMIYEIIFYGSLQLSFIGFLNGLIMMSVVYLFAGLYLWRIFKSNDFDNNEIQEGVNYIKLNSENFSVMDPLKFLPLINSLKLVSVTQIKNDKVKYSNLVIFLIIITSLLCKGSFLYFDQLLGFSKIGFFSIISFILTLLASILLFPINSQINILLSFKILLSDNNTECNQEQVKKWFDILDIRKTISLLPMIYGFLLFVFGLVSLIWGIFWTNPTKIYKVDKIDYSWSNKKVNSSHMNSQFCKLGSGPLSILQISALPSILNFFNRGHEYLEDLNQIQKHNLKILLQYIFGTKAHTVILNKTTLTQWGIQIIIPYYDNNLEINKNYTVQIFGGYRSRFDWVMFFELFVQKLFSAIVKSLIPGFQVITQTYKYISSIFQLYFHLMTSASAYSDKITEILRQNYLNHNNQVDLIVGQGIGGYFSKTLYFSINQRPQVFSFESIGLINSKYFDLNEIAPPSITNVFTNSMYSNYETLLDLNYKRLGRKSTILSEESFTSFCATVAQCAQTDFYDSLCKKF